MAQNCGECLLPPFGKYDNHLLYSFFASIQHFLSIEAVNKHFLSPSDLARERTNFFPYCPSRGSAVSPPRIASSTQYIYWYQLKRALPLPLPAHCPPARDASAALLSLEYLSRRAAFGVGGSSTKCFLLASDHAPNFPPPLYN